MATTFKNEKIVPVMLGTKCAKCWESISRGVFKGEVRGTPAFFCEPCHQLSKLRGGNP
jgi:hypothetical protein